MVKIAICEDDIFYMKKAKQLVEDFFKERELRFSLITFQSGIELTKNFRENYDIIFLDISMEDMRIHQSYLINREYLKTVCRYKAELIAGISLGISKKYYKDLEDYYIRMRGEF